MAMDDLFTALKMFQDGVQGLQTQRAIASANDQVQQIKASEGNDQIKRSQMQDLSNQLVSHLAGTGTPATTLQALAGAIGPKQYANSTSMFMDAQLTGNQPLAQEAQATQAFEQNPEYKKQLIAAKALNHSPMAQLAFQEKQDEFNQKQLTAYSKDLSSAKASSRSTFGVWAATEARGERLASVLGDPSKWKAMTGQELGLVSEGLTQMSKGGVATKEEQAIMMPFMAKLKAAQAETAVSGKPVAVDLSGFGQLYSNVIQREDSAAKEKMFDIVTDTITGRASLAKRPGASDQWKLTTATGLRQLGIDVNPETIQIDPKKGVRIPEIQPIIDAAAQAPKAVRGAYKDLQAGGVAGQQAQQFLQAYGLTPDMPLAQAIKQVRRHIKAKLFE